LLSKTLCLYLVSILEWTDASRGLWQDQRQAHDYGVGLGFTHPLAKDPSCIGFASRDKGICWNVWYLLPGPLVFWQVELMPPGEPLGLSGTRVAALCS
jgi:hypothetical protein